jgi:hypothetical protein
MEQPSSSAGIASFDGLNGRETRPNSRALQIFKSIKDPKAKSIESVYAHDPDILNFKDQEQEQE